MSNFDSAKLAISNEIQPFDSISAKSRALFNIRFAILGVPHSKHAGLQNYGCGNVW